MVSLKQIGTTAVAASLVLGGGLVALKNKDKLPKISFKKDDEGKDPTPEIIKTDVKKPIDNDDFKKIVKDHDFAGEGKFVSGHYNVNDDHSIDLTAQMQVGKGIEKELVDKELHLEGADAQKVLQKVEGKKVEVISDDMIFADDELVLDAKKVLVNELDTNFSKVHVKVNTDYVTGSSFAVAKLYDATGAELPGIYELSADATGKLIDLYGNLALDDSIKKLTKAKDGKDPKITQIGDGSLEAWYKMLTFAEDTLDLGSQWDNSLDDILTNIHTNLTEREEKTDVTGIYDSGLDAGKWSTMYVWADELAKLIGLNASNEITLENNTYTSAGIAAAIDSSKADANLSAAAEYLTGIVKAWEKAGNEGLVPESNYDGWVPGSAVTDAENAILNSYRDHLVNERADYLGRLNLTPEDLRQLNASELWSLDKMIDGLAEADAKTAGEGKVIGQYADFIWDNYQSYLAQLNVSERNQLDDYNFSALNDLEQQIDAMIGADNVLDDFRHDVWTKYGPDAEHNYLALKGITGEDGLDQYKTTTELVGLMVELGQMDNVYENLDAVRVGTEYAKDMPTFTTLIDGAHTIGEKRLVFDHSAEGTDLYNKLTNNLTDNNKTMKDMFGYNYSTNYRLADHTFEIQYWPDGKALMYEKDEKGSILSGEGIEILDPDTIRYIEEATK